MPLATMILAAMIAQAAADPTIHVDPDRVIHRISPYLYGACIEDVNHEIYGGLYSQMIFGESFQEPPRPPLWDGFATFGGGWTVQGGELSAEAGDGPKFVSDIPAFADGEVAVEVYFPDARPGNAGMIVRVDRPGTGADVFTGYEISLETSGTLVLGRHRRNWEPIKTAPVAVPVGRWIPLKVRMAGRTLEIFVDGKSLMTFEDDAHPLGPGRVGLRDWHRPARFRNLTVTRGGAVERLDFTPKPANPLGADVSGMWGPIRRGSASGRIAMESADPFKGARSQRLTFEGGDGAIGVENRGLNRWGLDLAAGKPYEGYIWVRSDRPAEVVVGLESSDGVKVLGESRLAIEPGGWTRHDFTITPNEATTGGRFAITLRRPGSVVVGHAFLQPGDWGRFKGLPDRKDVVEGLIGEGINVLRYGGSMVNHPNYRWKAMIGPRDRRPIGPGWWYPYSSNGWGIFDFLDICEAAGFLGIPAVHMGESPADMADFVAYANGPADSEWGRKRAADGHPEPYRLKHLELGNEEAVNEAYWEKFRPMAEAIWAKDPGIILIVGDFAYNRPIDDPDRFTGGVAVNSLATHRKILQLAKDRGREVWFDIHVSTDHPPEPNGLKAERSYIDWIGKLVPGAKSKVVIFEYNSGNHAMRRALSNALASNEVERIGDRLPIACAANCLQPDGQNDNGWDQGLLFLNPSKVWLQPPGHLVAMARRAYQPLLVATAVDHGPTSLSVNARRSDDGKTMVLQVVNTADSPLAARIDLGRFMPAKPSATVEELSGPLDAVNTADQPDRVAPHRFAWTHGLSNGRASYTFPPRSITMIRLD